MNGSVSVTYIGHACFALEWQGWRVVLDPYADGSVPGLESVRETADAVYCSHDHRDHGAVKNVKCRKGQAPAGFAVEELETEHDPCGGALRGKNTVRVFTFGALRCAHLGDLGRDLTEAECALLRDLDLLLLPVGGYYTIDAAQARVILDRLRPRVAVAMHYRTDRSGYAEIAHIDAALTRLGPAKRSGATLTLDRDTDPGLYVMQAKNEKERD